MIPVKYIRKGQMLNVSFLTASVRFPDSGIWQRLGHDPIYFPGLTEETNDTRRRRVDFLNTPRHIAMNAEQTIAAHYGVPTDAGDVRY